MNFRRVVSLILLSAGAILTPHAAFAVNNLQKTLEIVGGLVDSSMPVVVSLALFAFFWGLAMYLFGSGTAGGSSAHSGMFGAPATGQKRDGRAIMVMGVLVFFIMLSIWGLVRILQNTFEISGTETIRGNPYQIENPYYTRPP
jgi:hypothetical protein